jgi:hypothetical protein
MRRSFLRDIQLGHDLDARGDVRGEPGHGGGNRNLVQHAVDALTDPQPALERLDVDIRRPAADALDQQQIDELDHGGLAIGPDVDEVFLLDRGRFLRRRGRGGLGRQPFGRFGAQAVVLLDGLQDVLPGRQAERRIQGRTMALGQEHEPDVVDQPGVRGVVHGYFETVSVDPEGDAASAGGQFHGDQAQGLRARRPAE